MVSKQPRKQRKAFFNAPLHKKQKLVSAPLSEDVRKKYNKRSMPVRKGDKVRIMRGDFKDHEGKIEKVNLKRGRVFVEGATIKKADGTERFYPMHPSNLMIIKAEMKDERRMKR